MTHVQSGFGPDEPDDLDPRRLATEVPRRGEPHYPKPDGEDIDRSDEEGVPTLPVRRYP